MELEHSFTIPVPPEQAWQVLLDVAQVAPCMPGATVDSFDGDVVTGRIKVKVGPVAMTYAGTARFVERDEQSRTVRLEASGKETRGAGTASAKVRSTLQDEGGQTKVVVHTTLSVTGRPAQFGRGVMAEVGGRIIERFATNLAARCASGSGPAGDVAASNGSGPGAADASGPGASFTTAAAATMAAATTAAATTMDVAATTTGPAGGSPDGAADAATLDELHLPVRAYNGLRRAGIHTVGDLSARTEAELLGIENLGPQSVREIKERLAGIGRHLAEQPAGGGAAGANGAMAGADGAAANGAQPGTPGAATATAPRPPRPPDEEAIDLLSVAGFPVLKRALPVLGGLVVLLLVILGIRSRRRRG